MPASLKSSSFDSLPTLKHHTYGDLIDGTVMPLQCSPRLQGSVTHIKHNDNFTDELPARLR